MGLFGKSEKERLNEEKAIRWKQIIDLVDKYEKTNNYSEAAQVFANYILQVDYYDRDAWNGMAWNYYKAGMSNFDVLEYASFAVRLSRGEDYNILDTQACILWELGKATEAINAWDKSVKQMGKTLDNNIVSKIKKCLNTIFISYQFGNKRDVIPEIEEANNDLPDKFTLVKADNFTAAPIREKIIKEMRTSYFLIAIISRGEQLSSGKYGVSSYIIDEISMAKNEGREIFLLVEQGVDIEKIPSYWRNDEFIIFDNNGEHSLYKKSHKLLKEISKRRDAIMSNKINVK